MSAAKTVISNGVCQGDFDFAGHRALNIDLTDIISTQFGLKDANTMFAGPASGADANPTFRAMVVADLPAAAMLTTENLSGLENLFTSRTNLGLTTTASAANTATGLLLLNIAPPALEGVNFMRSNDGAPGWVTGASVLSTIGAEPVLGNPASNAYVLASTTLGVRSWVPQTAAVLPVVDTTALVKGSADATKLLRLEVDGFTTGTTRVMTVPDYNFTVASLAGVESLTNKTINEIVFASGGGAREVTFKGDVLFETAGGMILRGAGDVTFPIAGTLATLAGTETLTNKTLSGGLFAGFQLRSSSVVPAPSFAYLTLATDDDDSRELLIRVNGDDRMLSLGGDLSIAGALTLSGAFDATLTLTGNSTLTLPVSGTLATRENAETLANKTLEAVVGIGVKNGTSGFDLNIANSDTTGAADRTLSINLNNADKILSLTGNLLMAGAFNLTLTLTANSNVTLPTTGTVEARVPVPASAGASGAAGQTAYEAGFGYRCVATNTWQRWAMATW